MINLEAEKRPHNAKDPTLLRNIRYDEIDLRSSSEDHAIVPAADNLNLLTDQQMMLWNLFYGDGRTIGPIQKSEIDPARMVECLPNIWMCDIVYDQQDKVSEIHSRLQGTKLDEIYGWAMGYVLQIKELAKDMVLDLETDSVRTINLVLAVAKTRMPAFGLVKKLSGKLDYHRFNQRTLIPEALNSSS